MGDAGFLDDYLPYVLRQADQTLSAPFYAALATHGVGRSEWRVLAVLAEHGCMRVNDLAGAALSPQPTVTHALRRLETRELITRTTDTRDRRQRLVALTPAGRSLAQRLIVEARELEADALTDAGDLSELMHELRTLTRVIEARLADLADLADLTDTAPTHVPGDMETRRPL